MKAGASPATGLMDKGAAEKLTEFKRPGDVSRLQPLRSDDTGAEFRVEGRHREWRTVFRLLHDHAGLSRICSRTTRSMMS